jgi:SHAQKYF class myb-like DNA-binding protein
MLNDATASTNQTELIGTDTSRGVWSEEEHDRFLAALQKYPNGPWKAVADHVGTRSVRQVQTHAQKYHEKVARRLRGLRKDRKRVQRPEHRLDDEMLEICQDLQQDNALLAPKSSTKAAGKRQRQRSTKTMAAMAAKSLQSQAERSTKTVMTESERQDSASDAETKLSAGMDGVHVSDVGDNETECSLPGIEPTDVLLDDESFFELIEFLVDALSSSDSDDENGNGNDQQRGNVTGDGARTSQ